MRPFPKTFAVPRAGRIVSVTTHNRDQLRILRTELELLGRIHRILAMPPEAPVATKTGKYSITDIEELKQIVGDAGDPIVPRMIALIDQQSGDVGKEVMMSVVNDEAQKLALEAAEAGVLGSSDPQPDDPPKDRSPSRIADALAAAEAELAKASGSLAGSQDAREPVAVPDVPFEEPHAPVQPDLPSPAGVAEDVTAVAEPASGDTTPIMPDLCSVAEPTQPSDPTPIMPDIRSAADVAQPSDPVPTHTPLEAKGGCEDPPPDQELTASEAAIPEPASMPDPVANPQQPQDPPPVETDSSFSSGYTPERASRAVVDIEAGIRKLAGVLSTEVNAQWLQAKEAFHDIAAIRAKVDETNQASLRTLSELTRMKEAAAIALDGISVVRREAKLLREDAQRAKERADASAAAAEQAANQAIKEAEDARNASRHPASDS